MKLTISLTGSTGNMGRCALYEAVKLDCVEKIKILVSHKNKRIKKILKNIDKKYLPKVQIVEGRMEDKQSMIEFVKDSTLIFNLASVIPPRSDKYPEQAYKCNVEGVQNLVNCIEEIKENQPKLIQISTVAVYGNRTHHHPYAQIGDPLLFSPLDIYSLTKARGEYIVLESDIKYKTIIRQTAMVHKNLLMDNISDGLMFHTAFNCPLEWVSAEDSGKLIAAIIEQEYEGKLNESNFYNQMFNLGGGKKNQITGYDTLNLGFNIIGGTAKDYFKPNYNAIRNFHGTWFSDSLKLDNMFHYIHDDYASYFKAIGDSHFYFKLARIIPKSVISGLVIKPLLKDANAPARWVKDNNEAKIKATYYDLETYNKLGTDWNKFNLFVEGKDYFGNDLDFEKLKSSEETTKLNYYYDNDKPLSEITIEDLKNVARAHGGDLLEETFTTGDVYRKVKWINQDNEIFYARPFTVLKGGHWWNISYRELAWDFDRLAKKDKIYAQLWYLDHKKDENVKYYLDVNDGYKAKLIKF